MLYVSQRCIYIKGTRIEDREVRILLSNFEFYELYFNCTNVVLKLCDALCISEGCIIKLLSKNFDKLPSSEFLK